MNIFRGRKKKKELSPEEKIRRRRAWWKVVLIMLGLLLISELISGLLYRMVKPHLHGISDGMVFVLKNYGTTLGAFLIFPLYMLWRTPEIAADLQPARTDAAPERLAGNTMPMFLLGLLLGGGSNALCILLAWLHGDVKFVTGNIEWGTILLALLLVFVQSSSEEFMFRGYVLGSLRRRYSKWTAIIFSAFFFMALHLGNPGATFLAMADVAAIGFTYAICVCYGKSIWMTMGMHTAWNFTQNFIFGLPNSGLVSECSLLKLDAASASDSLFYSTGFGIEGSLPAFLIDALLGVIIFFICTRKLNRRLRHKKM